MAKRYIPSSTPGKHWQIGVGKTRDGFVTGYAVEGELGNARGFETFTFTMFQARRVDAVTTAKRATAKAEVEAERGIIAKLYADGFAATQTEQAAA